MIWQGTVLVEGEAEGNLLRLARPVSFWGGIDPVSGAIADPRHPQHGVRLGGRVVVMERVIGSSSGSSVLLELIAAGHAPAALILAESDCIATLGAVVARAMGYVPGPILLLPAGDLDRLPTRVHVYHTGCVTAA